MMKTRPSLSYSFACTCLTNKSGASCLACHTALPTLGGAVGAPHLHEGDLLKEVTESVSWRNVLNMLAPPAQNPCQTSSILNSAPIKLNASLLPRLFEGQRSFRPSRARAAPRVRGHVTVVGATVPLRKRNWASASDARRMWAGNAAQQRSNDHASQRGQNAL